MDPKKIIALDLTHRETITNQLADKHYRKPYPNSQTERMLHGVTHAAAAMLLVDLVIALYEKYFPDGLKKTDGEQLNEEDKFFLYLAVFCHDMANTQEDFHDEASQAELFSQEMEKTFGFNRERIAPFAKALTNKENDSDTSIFRIIIQSVDCLEFLRVLDSPQKFTLSRLSCYLQIKATLSPADQKNFTNELSHIILHHFQLAQFLKQPNIHTVCEKSPTPYTTMNEYVHIFAIMQKLKVTHIAYVNFFDCKKIKLNPLERHLPHTSKQLIDLLHLQLNDILPLNDVTTAEGTSHKNANDVINFFNTDGLNVREIRFIKTPEENFILKKINDEFQTLDANAKRLAQYNLKTAADILNFYEKNQQLPFIARPMSFIKQGIKISTITNFSAFLILPDKIRDLNFKTNIFSNNITSDFPLDRTPIVRAKQLSYAEFIAKLEENETRRQGKVLDAYNKHTYRYKLDNTETLKNYCVEDVLGILIGSLNIPERIIESLILQQNIKKVTGRELEFFHYDTDHALNHIPKKQLVDVLLGIVPAKSLSNSPPFFPPFKSRDCIRDVKLLSAPGEPFIFSFKFSPNPPPVLPSMFEHCKAQMKNGLPIITRPNGDFVDNQNLLNTWITNHYKTRTEECNKLLRPLSRQLEFVFNIQFPGIKLNTEIISFDKLRSNTQREKYSLEIQFQDMHSDAFSNTVPKFLKFIGFDTRNYKYETFFRDDIAVTPLTFIKIPALQTVECIYEKLHQLVEINRQVLKALENNIPFHAIPELHSLPATEYLFFTPLADLTEALLFAIESNNIDFFHHHLDSVDEGLATLMELALVNPNHDFLGVLLDKKPPHAFSSEQITQGLLAFLMQDSFQESDAYDFTELAIKHINYTQKLSFETIFNRCVIHKYASVILHVLEERPIDDFKGIDLDAAIHLLNDTPLKVSQNFISKFPESLSLLNRERLNVSLAQLAQVIFPNGNLIYHYAFQKPSDIADDLLSTLSLESVLHENHDHLTPLHIAIHAGEASLVLAILKRFELQDLPKAIQADVFFFLACNNHIASQTDERMADASDSFDDSNRPISTKERQVSSTISEEEFEKEEKIETTKKTETEKASESNEPIADDQHIFSEQEIQVALGMKSLEEIIQNTSPHRKIIISKKLSPDFAEKVLNIACNQKALHYIYAILAAFGQPQDQDQINKQRLALFYKSIQLIVEAGDISIKEFNDTEFQFVLEYLIKYSYVLDCNEIDYHDKMLISLIQRYASLLENHDLGFTNPLRLLAAAPLPLPLTLSYLVPAFLDKFNRSKVVYESSVIFLAKLQNKSEEQLYQFLLYMKPIFKLLTKNQEAIFIQFIAKLGKHFRRLSYLYDPQATDLIFEIIRSSHGIHPPTVLSMIEFCKLNVNAIHSGRTLLSFFVKQYDDILFALLLKGADVFAPCQNNRSFLHIALENNTNQPLVFMLSALPLHNATLFDSILAFFISSQPNYDIFLKHMASVPGPQLLFLLERLLLNALTPHQFTAVWKIIEKCCELNLLKKQQFELYELCYQKETQPELKVENSKTPHIPARAIPCNFYLPSCKNIQISNYGTIKENVMRYLLSKLPIPISWKKLVKMITQFERCFNQELSRITEENQQNDLDTTLFEIIFSPQDLLFLEHNFGNHYEQSMTALLNVIQDTIKTAWFDEAINLLNQLMERYKKENKIIPHPLVTYANGQDAGNVAWVDQSKSWCYSNTLSSFSHYHGFIANHSSPNIIAYNLNIAVDSDLTQLLKGYGIKLIKLNSPPLDYKERTYQSYALWIEASEIETVISRVSAFMEDMTLHSYFLPTHLLLDENENKTTLHI